MKLMILILAIAMVESGGNTEAVNQTENAVGWLQIRPICVQDVNRILGEHRFKLADRCSKEKSIQMFKIYTEHYIKAYKLEDTFENRARIWNGGPKGYKKNSTLKYWEKVRKEIKQ